MPAKFAQPGPKELSFQWLTSPDSSPGLVLLVAISSYSGPRGWRSSLLISSTTFLPVCCTPSAPPSWEPCRLPRALPHPSSVPFICSFCPFAFTAGLGSPSQGQSLELLSHIHQPPALSHLPSALQLLSHTMSVLLCVSSAAGHWPSGTPCVPGLPPQPHMSPRCPPLALLAAQLGLKTALRVHFWFSCPYPTLRTNLSSWGASWQAMTHSTVLLASVPWHKCLSTATPPGTTHSKVSGDRTSSASSSPPLVPGELIRAQMIWSHITKGKYEAVYSFPAEALISFHYCCSCVPRPGWQEVAAVSFFHLTSTVPVPHPHCAPCSGTSCAIQIWAATSPCPTKLPITFPGCLHPFIQLCNPQAAAVPPCRASWLLLFPNTKPLDYLGGQKQPRCQHLLCCGRQGLGGLSTWAHALLEQMVPSSTVRQNPSLFLFQSSPQSQQNLRKRCFVAEIKKSAKVF